MQMSRTANDMTVYWSNVGLSHVPDDSAATVLFVTVRLHNISELHTPSVYSQTNAQCDSYTVTKW